MCMNNVLFLYYGSSGWLLSFAFLGLLETSRSLASYIRSLFLYFSCLPETIRIVCILKLCHTNLRLPSNITLYIRGDIIITHHRSGSLQSADSVPLNSSPSVQIVVISKLEGYGSFQNSTL